MHQIAVPDDRDGIVILRGRALSDQEVAVLLLEVIQDRAHVLESNAFVDRRTVAGATRFSSRNGENDLTYAIG